MLDCYELLILRTLFLLLMLVYSRFGNCGIFCYSCCWGMPPVHCFGEHRSQKLENHGLDSIKGRSIIQYFNILNQHDNSGVSLTVLLTAQIEFLSKFRGLFSHNLINCNCLRGSLKHFAPKHPAFSSFSTVTIQPPYLLAYMQPYLS